ncbi:hypothetical protein [Daejeonella oryzae]|uniref:hypothetical protein n=1 Tax=Daejeonella oryzae TaxID=1122943 RepID=UPI000404C074|nr:NigD-like N-terminal domain-containing protein [Daejeonella oryzae]
MKILTTILLGASLLFSACDKKESVIENQQGTIRLFSNSACNVYIQLDGGQNIYPVNADKVESYLSEGRRVTVSYRTASDYASPCSNASSAIIEEIR